MPSLDGKTFFLKMSPFNFSFVLIFGEIPLKILLFKMSHWNLKVLKSERRSFSNDELPFSFSQFWDFVKFKSPFFETSQMISFLSSQNFLLFLRCTGSGLELCRWPWGIATLCGGPVPCSISMTWYRPGSKKNRFKEQNLGICRSYLHRRKHPTNYLGRGHAILGS